MVIRIGNKIQVSFNVAEDIWIRLKMLIGEKGMGLSRNKCIELMILDAISQGRIPGIVALEESHESRENQKYGTATPTYDGEPRTTPQPKPAAAKPSHAPRAR